MTSDVLCVAATLNSLGFLIQSRASVANKIIIAILQLDPYRRFEPPLTYATMIQMKALEKTLKAIITNVLKRYLILGAAVALVMRY